MLGWKVLGSGLSSLAVTAITQDVNAAVSAAGTTQATATELTSTVSDVTTVGSGSGVVLSSKLATGDSQLVLNSGANPLSVYPPTGMKINQLAANTAILLQPNTAAEFTCLSTTKIAGFLSA